MEYKTDTTRSGSIKQDTVRTYYFEGQDNVVPTATFIYVDDSTMDQWIAVKTLELTGVAKQVITACDGQEGFLVIEDYYEKNGCLPEVIMADLQMPKVDGLELIRRVKSLPFYSETETKLILLTAGLEDVDIKRVADLEIKNILYKPLNKEELMNMLSYFGVVL